MQRPPQRAASLPERQLREGSLDRNNLRSQLLQDNLRTSPRQILQPFRAQLGSPRHGHLYALYNRRTAMGKTDRGKGFVR
jgi:hypothetical protein